MAMVHTLAAWVVLSISAICGQTRPVDAPPAIDVPRLTDIKIDGDLADWADKGYRAGILTPVKGRIPEKRDFDPAVQLAWDAEGLLVAIDLADDCLLEADLPADFWSRDSLEVFLAPKVGAPGWSHATISPGLDAAHPDPRIVMAGHGTLAGTDLPKVQMARRKTPAGCTMEIRLPWKDLGIEPQLGGQVGFQIWFTDVDEPGQRPVNMVFCPQHDTSKDSRQMHALRLATKAGQTPQIVRAYADDFDAARLQATVTVIASDELAGKTASLAVDGKTFRSGTLQPAPDGRVQWRCVLQEKDPAGPADVLLGDRKVDTVDLPSVARMRAYALAEATPCAHPSVFYRKLPPVDFDQPLWVEALIGPYEIRTTYYDADYNVVRQADRPGRYGAVAEIRTRDSRVFRRFLTLFAMSRPYKPWGATMASPSRFDSPLQMMPDVAEPLPGPLGRMLSDHIRDEAQHSSYPAVMLAGLHERKQFSAPDDFWSQPELLDRQWWLGLKRRLYGWDKQWPEPVVCPQPLEGKPAPVVREGTLEEAGMHSDAAEKIDTVLTEWSHDTDEAFAVCIVRHGVIVLHKAYGTRDGKPMTVDTKSWMASTTKIMSGSLMMMLVDQGRLDLDDPAEKYLPALRGIKTNVPLTLRHLYTHTAGLDENMFFDNDLEERIANLLPQVQVANRYLYNGTAMAVACKALEAVSGETLPAFFQKHLLDPLGCTGTTSSDSSGSAVSVPLDMARIGQMLLNKGTYGPMRFMREETFRQMLPRSLDYILGQKAERDYGIGTAWFAKDGLGDGTFGHGAASAATLRIDPTHDMVIVMTRNAAGKNFEIYHPKFLRAVVDGLANPPTAARP